MARPSKQFDEATFEKLCAMMCSEDEICSFFNTTDKTIAKWCKRTYGMCFSDCLKRFGTTGKISLRRAQFKSAIDKGNVTMQIWLGKQWLGQKDKVENNIQVNQTEEDSLSIALRELAKDITND